MLDWNDLAKIVSAAGLVTCVVETTAWAADGARRPAVSAADASAPARTRRAWDCCMGTSLTGGTEAAPTYVRPPGRSSLPGVIRGVILRRAAAGTCLVVTYSTISSRISVAISMVIERPAFFLIGRQR